MVRLLINNIDDLLSELSEKKLFCYGAGTHFDEIMDRYSYCNLSRYVNGIIDSNVEMCGTSKEYRGINIPIITLQEFTASDVKDAVLLITNYANFMDIIDCINISTMLICNHKIQ